MRTFLRRMRQHPPLRLPLDLQFQSNLLHPLLRRPLKRSTLWLLPLLRNHHWRQRHKPKSRPDHGLRLLLDSLYALPPNLFRALHPLSALKLPASNGRANMALKGPLPRHRRHAPARSRSVLCLPATVVRFRRVIAGRCPLAIVVLCPRLIAQAARAPASQ